MALTIKEVHKRAHDHAYYVEDILIKHFLDSINAAVREQVNFGRSSYFCSIPPIVVGYPCYNEKYVANRVREAYMQSGFRVTGKELDIHLDWSV